MVKVTNLLVYSSKRLSATLKIPEGGREEKFERGFQKMHVNYTQQKSIEIKNLLNVLNSYFGKVTILCMGQ